jgi:hypothetical protein
MMRFAIAGAVGVTLGFIEAGVVAWFGCIIILGLAFLTKDVQDQTEQLTAQAGSIDHGVTAAGEGIADLQRELTVVTAALQATNRKLDNLTAMMLSGNGANPQGPWGAR